MSELFPARLMIRDKKKRDIENIPEEDKRILDLLKLSEGEQVESPPIPTPQSEEEQRE